MVIYFRKWVVLYFTPWVVLHFITWTEKYFTTGWSCILWQVVVLYFMTSGGPIFYDKGWSYILWQGVVCFTTRGGPIFYNKRWYYILWQGVVIYFTPCKNLRLPHIFLISEVNSCPILMFEYSFQSLWPALQESEVILPLGASKAPKIADDANFWTCFATFRCLIGLLVAKLLQMLVEEVISFEMSTQTSKLDKN